MVCDAARRRIRHEWRVSACWLCWDACSARPPIGLLRASWLFPPEHLESIRRHIRVSDGMRDVLVAEIVLQQACVMALVSKLEPAGVAQHARMHGKSKLRLAPDRVTNLRTLLAVIGPPRSETKRYWQCGHSRRSCRRALDLGTDRAWAHRPPDLKLRFPIASPTYGGEPGGRGIRRAPEFRSYLHKDSFFGMLMAQAFIELQTI
jgi:hypothetical protein